MKKYLWIILSIVLLALIVLYLVGFTNVGLGFFKMSKAMDSIGRDSTSSTGTQTPSPSTTGTTTDAGTTNTNINTGTSGSTDGGILPGGVAQ